MKHLSIILIALAITLGGHAQSENPVHDLIVQTPMYYVSTNCDAVMETMLPEIALMLQRLLAFNLPTAADMTVLEMQSDAHSSGLSAISYSMYILLPFMFCEGTQLRIRDIKDRVESNTGLIQQFEQVLFGAYGAR